MGGRAAKLQQLAGLAVGGHWQAARLLQLANVGHAGAGGARSSPTQSIVCPDSPAPLRRSCLSRSPPSSPQPPGTLLLPAHRCLPTAACRTPPYLPAAATWDASIAAYTAKYAQPSWRPITAIRAGAVPAASDPTWTPFLNTPPHPEHPSGAAACSALAAAHAARCTPGCGWCLRSPPPAAAAYAASCTRRPLGDGGRCGRGDCGPPGQRDRIHCWFGVHPSPGAPHLRLCVGCECAARRECGAGQGGSLQSGCQPLNCTGSTGGGMLDAGLARLRCCRCCLLPLTHSRLSNPGLPPAGGGRGQLEPRVSGGGVCGRPYQAAAAPAIAARDRLLRCCLALQPANSTSTPALPPSCPSPRSYGGIHLRHAVEEGARLGERVAQAVLAAFDGKGGQHMAGADLAGGSGRRVRMAAAAGLRW